MTNAFQTYGMKPLPALLIATHNVGHVPIVVPRTISQTIVLTCYFVITHNALDHLIAENLDLQYAVTITTDSVQETHAPISTSACLARATTHTSPVQTNNEAMPGRAYTTYTTTLEHILCTEVIGYTDTKLLQNTSCSNGLDSGHTTSHIETLECNSCMEGLYHVHTPYSSTLGCNPYMVTHSQTNTHSLGTKAPQPVHIPFTNPPKSPCIPAEHLPQQLQNLIAIHKLHNTPRTPINIHNLHRELLSHPDQTYV